LLRYFRRKQLEHENGYAIMVEFLSLYYSVL